jgi:hypothetical protein
VALFAEKSAATVASTAALGASGPAALSKKEQNGEIQNISKIVVDEPLPSEVVQFSNDETD